MIKGAMTLNELIILAAVAVLAAIAYWAKWAVNDMTGRVAAAQWVVVVGLAVVVMWFWEVW